MRLDLASYTNAGGREVNEDATLCLEREGVVIAAVADGLGGHGGGKIASSLAVKTLEEQANDIAACTREAVRAACERANEAVLAAQTPQQRMKTTLALAIVAEDCMALAHIGDSRIYYFHDDKIEYQSLDHSVSQLAVLTGSITAEQIRFHEDRNKVLRSLGSENGAAPEIELITRPFAEGDAILICTDGFWEYVYEREMLRALRHAKSARDWLERMTPLIAHRAKKDNDNNTAVVVFSKKPVKSLFGRAFI
ncbi:MAG: protein phosphatase 2C domain-containing protein [Christensenella sp.]|nr:protein phosphatase 2C domain-containing protein [Christensenella sp.]